jgi:tetratricopeptide (TPR) repeat protein
MATPPVHVALPIVLTAAERATLERWARGRRVPRRLVRRARIILQAAAGRSNAAIARALRTDRECVGRWRARFAAQRLPGLSHEAARPGRPPGIPDALLPALVTLLTMTLVSKGRPTTTGGSDGRPWSYRALARLAAQHPAYPDLHFGLSLVAEQLGELDRAIEAAEKAITINPRYAEAHLLNEAIRERMVFSGPDYFDPVGQYSTVQGQPMYYFSREQEFADLIEGAGFRILTREKVPPYPAKEHMPFCAGGMCLVATKP